MVKESSALIQKRVAGIEPENGKRILDMMSAILTIGTMCKRVAPLYLIEHLERFFGHGQSAIGCG
eukprot:10468417-Prorocentrum_lima.AAC.1